MFKIRVQGGKYVVVRVTGNTERPARNWKHLANDAKQAVRNTSGSTMHMGLYPCPAELERRAK